MHNSFRPLLPVNPNGLDEIADALLQNNATTAPDSSGSSQPGVNIQNPEKYIILTGRSHGSYSYPDLFVAMDRTHYGKNWKDAHLALSQEESQMLSIRQFVDFLNLLRSGKVHDGTGRNLNKTKINAVLDEILTVRNPWRSEWLDADFKVKDKKLGIVGGKVYMNYEHCVSNGNIIPKHSEEIRGYLASNKTPGIDLDEWLKNATSHGLPPANIKDGSLYYWQPGKDNNSVAGFVADSGGAYLDCDWGPSYAVASLGVRAARKK